MGLPKAIREKILNRLESLISESQAILETCISLPGEVRTTDIAGNVIRRGPDYEVVDTRLMVAWATKCINVLG
ncbi:MAG: hypothetical protein ABIK89_19310, partial [Planctomycetota bacterium]